jgi:hypothetical protein
MIARFLLAGIGGAAVLFMVRFLTALVQESRAQRLRRKDQRQQKSLTLVMLERYRNKDRTA